MALIEESQSYIRGGTQKDEYSPEEVVTVPCPLCGSNRRQRIYTEHGSIGISQCLSCSLVYTCPRIRAPEKIYWGDRDAYFDEARLIFEGKAPHHRDPNYREELHLIRRHKPEGRFLDVGCNLGMLLRWAQRMGWTAVGVEPSPSVSQLAAQHWGFQVYNCFLRELPKNEEGSFDVIALSDVLEHVPNPKEFLGDVVRFLAKDGIVYIKVPNGRWSRFKQEMLLRMGRRPQQGIWDSYEHVVHYTDQTLNRMLGQAGLKVFQMSIASPVQTPVWHLYVGHYYQYPSPWILDWKRHLGRSLFHRLSRLEQLLRGGSIGHLAPNLVALARRAG